MKKAATILCFLQLLLVALWFLRAVDANFRVFGEEFYLGILSAVLVATPVMCMVTLRDSTKE